MDESQPRRDPQGRLLVLVSESRDEAIMRRAGELLEQSGAQAKDRFWSAELRFWDYALRDTTLSLCWEQEFGLSLLAGELVPACEALVRRLAAELRSRLG